MELGRFLLKLLSDEEDEGLDSEEVNFNEMVLEDEARLAVRNKRGRRFERIEFSNRFGVVCRFIIYSLFDARCPISRFQLVKYYAVCKCIG